MNEIQGLQTDIKIYSLIVFIIIPNLKEIGL